MTYTQLAPKFEAVQLGSGDGAQDAFLAATGYADGDPRGQLTVTKNSDGSITFSILTQSWAISPTQWTVSPPYWGAFPGWATWAQVGTSAPIVDDADFTAQYTATGA